MPNPRQQIDVGREPRWCRICGRPDRDLGLHAMSKRERGTGGWYDAMRSWSPEPCECEKPDWDPYDD